ncbi:hypothetical protein T12_7736 [Trichinella patagoniensis]|uniref:Uncharacterized protein n=1 Tax=Trichinella patagoniensis TaxID=990121 RepID=A0A0V0Z9E4_9BILA|nr:hypothetical protein T12_7736 [Trichinella patagoniensis]
MDGSERSQLTDFPMYRLAEVEVAALYPRIREVALNRGSEVAKVVDGTLYGIDKGLGVEWGSMNSGIEYEL